MKGMGKVPKEEKPAMGKLINEAKTAVTAEFDAVIERIEAAELAAKLGPAIDPTLAFVPIKTVARSTRSLRCATRW